MIEGGYIKYSFSTSGYQDIKIQFNRNVAVSGTDEYCQLSYRDSRTTTTASYTILESYTSNTGLTAYLLPSNANDKTSIDIQFENIGQTYQQDSCYLEFNSVTGK